ncbi:MAG: hypothetical protein LBD23_06025 [Oscillospiraceae bacterium]|jgi:hypothetical protein|nr:hypothetical protein [Oscillospiraceae bacterium]
MKKVISTILLILLLAATSSCTTTGVVEENPIHESIPIELEIEFGPPVIEIEPTEIIPEIEIGPLFIIPVLNEPLKITSDQSAMPAPIGAGDKEMMIFTMLGTGHADFSKLDEIPLYIRDAFIERDDYSIWSNDPEWILKRSLPVTSLMDYKNPFSLVVSFNIPPNELAEVMRGVQQRFKVYEIEDGNDYSCSYFSDEEIEIFTSLDEARILEYFISEFSIFHDGRGFTPSWIYHHTLEDYEAVGLTAEMIEEKLHLYAEFSFTEEATLAFEAKLSEFLGRDVILANEQKATYTTADALVVLRRVAGLDWLADAQKTRLGIIGEPDTADVVRILRVVAGL